MNAIKCCAQKLLLFAAILGVITPAFGHTWLELESEHLGNGCFRYRVGSRLSPMLKDFAVTGFGLGFTNGIQFAPPPPGWTNHHTATWTTWGTEDPWFWQVRPYDAVFEVCSPMTNYTVGIGTVIMNLTLYEFSGYSRVYSANVVGYANMPALVPSSLAADPFEPATLYTNLTFLDAELLDLKHTNGMITGVVFKTPYAGTYRLEGSSAMNSWTGITYLNAGTGTTVWNSQTDLKAFGSFFRLSYLGAEDIPTTNLPPLGMRAGGTITRASERKFLKTDVSATPKQFTVGIASAAGTTYRIEVVDNANVVWQRVEKAESDTLTITIPRSGLPAIGMIRAIAVE